MPTRDTMDLWDPGQFSRNPPLPEDGLDPNMFPVHPPGTWESALATLSAGYRPTPEDIKALRHWSKNTPATERFAYLRRQRKTRLEVTAAARDVMARREVLPLSTLERRIHAHLDGRYTHPTITGILTAVTTPVMLDAEVQDGIQPVAHLYRQFYTVLGKHVHYFSRSRRDLEAYPVKAYAARQDVGRRWGDSGKGYRFTSETSQAANTTRWERQRQRQQQRKD